MNLMMMDQAYKEQQHLQMMEMQGREKMWQEEQIKMQQ